jgi:hypothetical protein
MDRPTAQKSDGQPPSPLVIAAEPADAIPPQATDLATDVEAVARRDEQTAELDR